MLGCDLKWTRAAVVSMLIVSLILPGLTLPVLAQTPAASQTPATDVVPADAVGDAHRGAGRSSRCR